MPLSRSSYRKFSIKKSVLIKFEKFTGRHLCKFQVFSKKKKKTEESYKKKVKKKNMTEESYKQMAGSIIPKILKSKVLLIVTILFEKKVTCEGSKR